MAPKSLRCNGLSVLRFAAVCLLRRDAPFGYYWNDVNRYGDQDAAIRDTGGGGSTPAGRAPMTRRK
eukprot:2640293-Pleurochrysis_carterae.AAC.2